MNTFTVHKIILNKSQNVQSFLTHSSIFKIVLENVCT